jgi:hypothetical protein
LLRRARKLTCCRRPDGLRYASSAHYWGRKIAALDHGAAAASGIATGNFRRKLCGFCMCRTNSLRSILMMIEPSAP